jgi:hypothetical protein
MAQSKAPKITGKALDWSDAEIDRLTEITPEDVASAKAVYRRLAPKKAKRLLDAKTKDDGNGSAG